eukprot:538788-Amphidinium_carterae.1
MEIIITVESPIQIFIEVVCNSRTGQYNYVRTRISRAFPTTAVVPMPFAKTMACSSKRSRFSGSTKRLQQ